MMGGEKTKLKKQKYNEFYMNLAERVAKMSYAKRLQVGSVLVKNDNIISFGWNGMPSGWDNNCEDVETTFDVRDTCNSNDWKYEENTKKYYRLKTKPQVLHSEQNLLMKLSKSSNSSNGAYLFVTHAPCLDCAKLVYQSGISTVYYRNEYRTDEGIRFLEKCGVKVERV